MPQDSLAQTAAGGHRTSHDFRPEPPTSKWRVDRVAVAYQVVPFAERPAAVQVGLYDAGPNGPHHLTISGHSEKTYTIPVAQPPLP